MADISQALDSHAYPLLLAIQASDLQSNYPRVAESNPKPH
jgi:hypothetical protein